MIVLLFWTPYLVNVAFAVTAEQYGYKLTKYPTMTIVPVGKRLCQRKCEEYARCLSVNYNREMLTCELLDEQATSEADLLVSSGYVYISQEESNIQECNLYEIKVTLSSGRSGCHPDLDSLDCKSLRDAGFTTSGVYGLFPFAPQNYTSIAAYCDMETADGGWTVFHRRFNGSLSFNKDWLSYKEGFGSPDAEHWLGNEYLHGLTSRVSTSLRVRVKDLYGDWKFAMYSSFSVDNETNGYRLNVSGYRGNAGDSFYWMAGENSHYITSGQRFTTYDRDNDNSINPSENCAGLMGGGWWFDQCSSISNLNGVYCGLGVWDWKCNLWYMYSDSFLGMEKSVMMLRRN